RGAADAELLAAAQAAGRLQRFRGYHEWTTLELEVESGRPVEVGVDGEALVLEPPLRFAVRPAALTVRLPRSAVARSARRPARMDSARAVAELWRVAIGRSAGAP